MKGWPGKVLPVVALLVAAAQAGICSPPGLRGINLAVLVATTPSYQAPPSHNLIIDAVFNLASPARSPWARSHTAFEARLPALQQVMVAGLQFRELALHAPFSPSIGAPAMTTPHAAFITPPLSFDERVPAVPEMNATPAALIAQPQSQSAAASARTVASAANFGQHSSLSIPVRVGRFTVAGNLDAQQFGALTQSAFAPSQGSTVDRVSAGAQLDLRTFGQRIPLNVSTQVQQYMHAPSAGLSVPALANSTLGGADNSISQNDVIAPMALDGSYMDIARRSVGAAAAVPIAHGLTLKLQYDTQYYTGMYGSALGQTLDGRNNLYLGNVSYTLPHRDQSTISLSAKQYRYRDAFVPSFNQTQNRADLKLTIKF